MVCVFIHAVLTVAMLLFLNSDKTQLHAMPMHCSTVYTLTEGIISHFPYLSVTLCVRAWASACVNGASFPCDRWSPIVAVHVGVAESHFWMRQPSHLPRIFLIFFLGGGVPVELDRLKICASALAGCAWVLEHHTVPNKAKAGQSKPGFQPKACAENSFFNIM